MADVVYINEEEGKKRVMNNGKLYAKLLGKFKADTNIEELPQYVESQEWDKAQAAVHTIKGIAANLSLTELFSQSLDVEAQIKGKSLKGESLENFKACHAETVKLAEEVINKYA
jgi:HPt (histidine-containing phosphotransfer) domain-containing protein